MLETVDLDPQDGDVELVEAIENAFGLTLTQSDVENWRTLGDIHATLSRLVPAGSAEGSCPTAMTFYALRRTLGVRDIKPSSSLASIVGPKPSVFLRHLSRETGLRMPAASLRFMGLAGCGIMFLAAIAIIATLAHDSLQGLAVGGALLLLGAALLRADPGTLPKDIETFGDFVRRVAALNFAKLRASGAREIPDDLWQAMCVVVAEIVSIESHGFAPETFIFRKVMLAEQAAERAKAA